MRSYTLPANHFFVIFPPESRRKETITTGPTVVEGRGREQTVVLVIKTHVSGVSESSRPRPRKGRD